jgi:hypothetical protein
MSPQMVDQVEGFGLLLLVGRQAASRGQRLLLHGLLQQACSCRCLEPAFCASCVWWQLPCAVVCGLGLSHKVIRQWPEVSQAAASLQEEADITRCIPVNDEHMHDWARVAVRCAKPQHPGQRSTQDRKREMHKVIMED